MIWVPNEEMDPIRVQTKKIPVAFHPKYCISLINFPKRRRSKDQFRYDDVTKHRQRGPHQRGRVRKLHNLPTLHLIDLKFDTLNASTNL